MNEYVTILKHVLMKHKHEMQQHITKFALPSPVLRILIHRIYFYSSSTAAKAFQSSLTAEKKILMKEWGITECDDLKFRPN
jgi:hypothetical protein